MESRILHLLQAPKESQCCSMDDTLSSKVVDFMGLSHIGSGGKKKWEVILWLVLQEADTHILLSTRKQWLEMEAEPIHMG